MPRGGAADRRSRRAAAALGAVSAGLLVLSACDKPSPIATVTVGGISVSTETDCYTDVKEVTQEEIAKCLKAKDLKSITIDTDEKVRFGVDPEIADKGWTILLNGQPLMGEPTKKTYLSVGGYVFFNAQYGIQGDTVVVSIREGKNKATGVWSFKFKKEDDS
jgi:hypothetical protein